MIVTCPACQVKYVTERSAFPEEGRILRCSSCGHSWRQKPLPLQAPPMPITTEVLGNVAPQSAAAAAVAVAPVTPSSSAVEKALSRITPIELFGEQELSSGNNNASPLVFGWLALVAIVAMLGGAAYFMRDTVKQRFPSARPLFNLVFSNDEARQFIEGPQVERVPSDNGGFDLVVKGQVRNQDALPVTPPAVNISLQNAVGITVAQERFTNYPLKSLLPKSVVPFEVRLKKIPNDAVDIKIEIEKELPTTAPVPNNGNTPTTIPNEPVAVPQPVVNKPS